MSRASSPEESLASGRWPSESVSLPPSSTAPSSPGPYNAEFDTNAQDDIETAKDEEEEERLFEDEDTDRRFKRLQFVLDKSAVYSSILKARMEEDRARQQQRKRAQSSTSKEKIRKPSTGTVNGQKLPNKRGRSGNATDEEALDDENYDRAKKKVKNEFGEIITIGDRNEEEDEPPIFDQPALITGAKLKSYQLEGLQWMVSLDQNGISGILADEMGLGKTLQVIAFSAYLREHHNFKPFLIVCPLSVLHNWIDEYRKFAPKIPVCMYHGTPEERAKLRSSDMALPGTSEYGPNKTTKSRSKQAKTKSSKAKKSKSKRNYEKTDNDETGNEEHAFKNFPIVVTTYEIIIKDRALLAPYEWGYIVVDEGHRLKNLDCKLMREIKKYNSAGRMILTGTPLHNNLAELWSLLNFILPDIFDDVDAFQEWFNLPTMSTLIGSTRSSQLITSLHAILKPFLLRRMKGDVEMKLPPKKEYVLYAPLTVRQRQAYQFILEGRMREWLIGGGVGSGHGVTVKESRKEVKKENDDDRRRLRGEKKGRKKYADLDGDDDQYFELLEKGEIDERGALKSSIPVAKELGKDHQYQSKLKQVNNMRLQNTVMQLRKVCSHPFLFDWPLDQKTHEPVLGRELVNASGKMLVLDRLLRELFDRGHKVLLFSQFTTMLDIVEAWATDYMNWDLCRIDGSTNPQGRRSEMERFQGKDGPRLFLLSTRAGGLGINLTAADTVIFYDQDWNPQMDAQAQDRAHRIGQTRPVLVFRLVSAHTIETKIMQKATEKKKLEALVIAKGKFKKPAAAAGAPSGGAKTMAEMAAALLKLEADKIEVVPPPSDGDESKYQVLSDEELDVLLDRRPEVFVDRGKGWTNVRRLKKTDMEMDKVKTDAQGEEDEQEENEEEEEERAVDVNGKRAAFAVYEAPKENGDVNDALARMLGEDD